MGENFQGYSWIQDFEADFPQKVSLKMLNYTDYISFSDLFSVYLKELTWNCWCFIGILQVLKFECLKVWIFEILNFHPWTKK